MKYDRILVLFKILVYIETYFNKTLNNAVLETMNKIRTQTNCTFQIISVY